MIICPRFVRRTDFHCCGRQYNSSLFYIKQKYTNIKRFHITTIMWAHYSCSHVVIVENHRVLLYLCMLRTREVIKVIFSLSHYYYYLTVIKLIKSSTVIRTATTIYQALFAYVCNIYCFSNVNLNIMVCIIILTLYYY